MNALKANGLQVGFPDLVLLGKQGVAFMEVKKEGGRLSPPQTKWRDTLKAMGIPWACVRSIDDAAESLREWGWMR
jgi:hypothetical protein